MAFIAQLGERQTEDLKVPGSIPGGGIFVLSRPKMTPEGFEPPAFGFGIQRAAVAPWSLVTELSKESPQKALGGLILCRNRSSLID